VKVVPSADAIADLVRLRDFLSSKSPNAARRAGATLETAMASLSEMPRRGRPLVGTEMRELIVRFGASAYVIRYVVDDTRDEVVVLRIWHGREQRE
jgi:toxin ParE1/3/4